jgi:hypothetical protein
MLSALDLINLALESFILLSRRDDKLRAQAVLPETHPLTSDLAARLEEHKEQLLAYLDFEAEADALLLEATHRLAAAWPPGCRALEQDARWSALEDELCEAYRSQRLPELKQVIAARERYALSVFRASS